MSATPRSGLLEWRCSRFEGLDIPPGFCSWCGERIWLVNPQDYRRARRTRHYGDEHELEDRSCRLEALRSRAWDARSLIQLRGDPSCVDCGAERGVWEADHDLALINGGAHCPTNILRRCSDCHKDKTAREARQRAQRRRAERAGEGAQVALL